MPQLRIVDLSTYKAYSQELAIGHRDIAGFKWGDKEVIQTGARSDAAGSFLWAIPYEDSSVSGDVDHAMKQREVRLAYLQPRASERFADEDAFALGLAQGPAGFVEHLAQHAGDDAFAVGEHTVAVKQNSLKS